MALDATISGANSSSYQTVATAQTYFDERLHCTDWTGATPTDKEKALIQACRIIDTYCLWKGIKTVTAQALEWPRIGIYYDGVFYYAETDGTRWVLASDEIPQQILVGQCELALVLLGNDIQSADSLESLNVAGLKMNLGKSKRRNQIIPSSVWQIMSPLGKLRGASGTVKLLRC